MQHVKALAQTVASNCDSAVEFDSEGIARELLASLEYEPEIDAACIFTETKDEFASYQREGYEGPVGEDILLSTGFILKMVI
ncbi:MAG: CHASE sensor domain-containing protein [Planctomycetaceae bacterium]